MITHEYISIRSKNLSGTLEFLCEVLQQQKPLKTWLERFQTTTDSIKLTDILINLTLPMDIMSKFDQIILKNSDSTIQLVSMKFLSMILERVKEALNIIMNVSLACNKISTLEAYQQAILRVSLTDLNYTLATSAVLFLPGGRRQSPERSDSPAG
jgi:transcription termination factor NusB